MFCAQNNVRSALVHTYLCDNRQELGWWPRPEDDFSGGAVHAYFFSAVTFFILFSYMVPMTLYVVAEIGKLAAGCFIEWDQHFVLEVEREGGGGSELRGARTVSSSVIEELARPLLTATHPTPISQSEESLPARSKIVALRSLILANLFWGERCA